MKKHLAKLYEECVNTDADLILRTTYTPFYKCYNGPAHLL